MVIPVQLNPTVAAVYLRRSHFIQCRTDASDASPPILGEDMLHTAPLVIGSELSSMLQQIVDNTSTVIYVKDCHFHYMLVNSRFEQLFGVSRRDIVGKTDFDLFSPEMATGFRENDERVVETGAILECEEVAPHADGPHTYISVKFPLRNEVGCVVAVAGISTDISDRINARREIESLRRRYESILSSAGDGICGLDNQGRVTFVNPAVERLLGYAPEELLGKCRKSFVINRTGEPTGCPVTAVMSGGDARQVSDAEFRCRDGSIIPVEYVATPLREDGETVGAVVAFRDVRARIELVKAEHEMRAARAVQMALYPKCDPTLAGFDISGVTHPSSLTSGDYYDYIPGPDGSLTVVVGDVSGHGLGPALEMVETRASLRTILSYETEMSKVLQRLNKVLANDLPDGMFVTLFAVRIDPNRRVIQYASAGHQANILFHSDEVTQLNSTGTVLGVFEAATYENSREIPLQPGDLIVLATDGIMEQNSGHKLPEGPSDLFGWTGTMESVRRNQHLSASQILVRLCQDVREFAAGSPQKDDVTAVIIKVL